MSAVNLPSIDYVSQSLPEPHQIAKSSDGQLIQELLSFRVDSAYKLTEHAQALLDHSGLLHWMGYTEKFDYKGPRTVANAIAHLDRHCWTSLMDKAEFKMLMPAARRNSFTTLLESSELPPFTEEHVIPTVQEWLLSQDLYFAERVDAIFRGLSDTHVTNSPAGFNSKLIIAESKRSDKIRLMDELRLVLSCLTGRMGRLEAAQASYFTEKMLNGLISNKQFNVPIDIDNGVAEIRIFKVGTIHIKIDTELACHLNDILAMLYPHAIPSKFRRTSPIKRSKFQAQSHDFIPTSYLFDFLNVLDNSTLVEKDEPVEFSFYRKTFPYSDRFQCALLNNPSRITTKIPSNSTWDRLFHAIGGRKIVDGLYVAPYYFKDVIPYLSQRGSIPNLEDFQFYPTLDELATIAAERIMAHHTKGLRYLEPSAGHADLIRPFGKRVPKETIQTVELSELNALILKSQGYNVICADFIEQAIVWERDGTRFDRVLMNPPFKHSQALNHTMAAYQLMTQNGVLVAILPNSLRNAFDHLQATLYKSESYKDAFEGASVEVFILEIQKH